MDELRELYQEMILDHHRNPRNFGKMESPNHQAEGYNPLCGDRITIYLVLEEDKIVDIAFDGSGCAICTASASLMTDRMKGKTTDDLAHAFKLFQELVTSDPGRLPDTEALGKLAVFAGVREYPIRVKCATLGWHTLKAAVESDARTVTTE